MRKKVIKPRKLQLSRETLLDLEAKHVVAGVPLTPLVTLDVVCPSITCPPVALR